LACAFERRYGFDFEFEATPKPLQLANVPIATAEAIAFKSRDFIQIRQGVLIFR
jgi:hypothetical protein